MNAKYHTTCRFAVPGLIAVSAIIGGSHCVLADAPGEIHAKGVAILSTAFSVEPGRCHVSLDWSLDGATFEPTYVGTPRRYQLVQSQREEGDRRHVLVVAALRFQSDGVEDVFLFPQAGVYDLRWTITHEGQGRHEQVVQQRVSVAKPLPADERMLGHLGDAEVFRVLAPMGKTVLDDEERFREMIKPEWMLYRVRVVFEELVRCIRDYGFDAVTSRRHFPDDVRVWGEKLLELAMEEPDSTYTPYVAYYAGCCYARLALGKSLDVVRNERAAGVQQDKAERAARIAALVKADSDTERASKAFDLAARRADEYMKPRILYQQGHLAKVKGNVSEARRLLSAAEAAAPGDTTIARWSAKLRKQLGDGDQLEAKPVELPADRP